METNIPAIRKQTWKLFLSNSKRLFWLLLLLVFLVSTTAVHQETFSWHNCRQTDGKWSGRQINVDRIGLSRPSKPMKEEKWADFFWVDCDYDNIDSLHFPFHNVTNTTVGHVKRQWATLKFLPTSGMDYRCKLTIDAQNCSRSPPPVYCQDVQVDIRAPEAVERDLTAMGVSESVALVTHDKPGFEKYIIWLNFTNYTAAHAGEYRFRVRLMPSEVTLFENYLKFESMVPEECVNGTDCFRYLDQLLRQHPSPFRLFTLNNLLVSGLVFLVLVLVIIASSIFIYLLRNNGEYVPPLPLSVPPSSLSNTPV